VAAAPGFLILAAVGGASRVVNIVTCFFVE
jgi:hypothetical protein